MQEAEYRDPVNEAELEQLAHDWLAELRNGVTSCELDLGQDVVSMNFSASPEIQWRFVMIAVSLSESDDELGHVAAGPIEHLLGWHGEEYISIVENEARTNPKFARALTGVWHYMMSDEIWSRLQVLQKHVAEPLRASNHNDTE
jgi:hypothetical protein